MELGFLFLFRVFSKGLLRDNIITMIDQDRLMSIN